MGMYIRQDEQRSKLQEKIAADLRAKAAAKANGSAGDIEAPKLDGADDAGIVENTHTSSPVMLAIWLIIGVAAVGTIIFLVVQSS